ncbi:hypothetical protein [Sinomonas flava]|uniref:Uncharacterized protein n=1 Tax=Sinomonas flava TaxID=496857 RepID=A0ABP5NK33_9MICC
MDNEIQLINDGDGLAVIGESSAVERFLTSEGLPSRELRGARLGTMLGAAATAAQVGSELSANSGRWVKMTEESAQLVKKYGLMQSSKTGLNLGVVQAQGGQIKGIIQFVPGAALAANPAGLALLAAQMHQASLQQSLDEITEYLEVIDEKVDDILRAQKDAVLADMIGVDFVVEEAMTVREEVGRVSEVTWSKVQSTTATVARTQGYALRQLDALADKVDDKAKIGELAKVAKDVESKIHEWLAIIARCFQLQDAIAVLELDRVLDASPEELNEHRLGLKAARQNRRELISQSTEHVLRRIDAAAEWANTKVLLHPTLARSVVASSNRTATGVIDFQGRLGIESSIELRETQRWVDAVADVRDRVIDTGAESVDAAKQLGDDALDRVKSTKNKLSSGVRAFRAAIKEEERVEES